MVLHLLPKLSQVDDRPQLAMVIVNYNSWPDVTRLAGELARAPEIVNGLCEIVVVDNASLGPVPAFFDRPPRGVQLVARTDNGGFAVGVNAGWRVTRAPWLLLLNPDVIACADLPGRILERIRVGESRPGEAPGVVGFALRNADGTRQPSVGADPSLLRCLREAFIPRSRRKYQVDQLTKPGNAPWVTGAFALVRAELLSQLGGMDEDFFLYYEEVALCRRARSLRWSVEYDPSVEVVHLRPLQSRLVSPKLRVITRHSKLLYFRKHRPHWEFLALSWIVTAESAVRGSWAALLRRREVAWAWTAVAFVSRALRHGATLRGSQVLALAEGHRTAGLPHLQPGHDAMSGPHAIKSPPSVRSQPSSTNH
jgi:GT2 family glycosyltransferase